MAAGDRDGLVAARVGGRKQGSLESGLDFPHPAEVDQEPAVDADESLVRELLLQPVETAGRGQEPAPVGDQPDVVAVGLGEADPKASSAPITWGPVKTGRTATGHRTVAEIVAELRGRYDRVDDEEVRLFLARLAARRCVKIGHG